MNDLQRFIQFKFYFFFGLKIKGVKMDKVYKCIDTYDSLHNVISLIVPYNKYNLLKYLFVLSYIFTNNFFFYCSSNKSFIIIIIKIVLLKTEIWDLYACCAKNFACSKVQSFRSGITHDTPYQRIFAMNWSHQYHYVQDHQQTKGMILAWQKQTYNQEH